MNSEIKIRPAVPTDWEVSTDFNARLASETEDHELDQATLSKGVAQLLADSTKGRYFVAENDTAEIVGQLMFTYEWSDWRNGNLWWLQSVYVRSDFPKQGVFSALLNHVTELAPHPTQGRKRL